MGRLISEKYAAWQAECEQRFQQLKQNEEELNRIFIDIYGLQDELTPEVEDKDVTVRKADLGREIRSLISYAVGCMFGRYSLDAEGLAYAGGEWDAAKYKTFQPDKDAILPICDDDYFEDDIMGRFVEWVKTVYGKATLEENLKFIADALGGKGSPLPLVVRNILIKSSATASQAATISGGYAELNKLTELLKFCSMIVAALPMLVIYPFVQKYFEKGFMAGAVKG